MFSAIIRENVRAIASRTYISYLLHADESQARTNRHIHNTRELGMNISELIIESRDTVKISQIKNNIYTYEMIIHDNNIKTVAVVVSRVRRRSRRNGRGAMAYRSEIKCKVQTIRHTAGSRFDYFPVI